MSDVQIFNFKGNEVRVVLNDGEIWWVAKDVCDTLGLSNVTVSLSELDDDERSKFNLGRQKDVNIISEAGLYSLVLRSRKPEAKEFKRWVTHDVLPTIRKTGSYGLDVPNFKDPVAAARAWADAMEAKIALEGISKEQQLLIEEMKPKVYYTDTILQSDSLVQTTQIAKDYGMSARAFNKKLHELGVQYNTGSQWVLYQKYQDAGYAHSYTYEYTRPDGSHGTKMHLKWTQKGRLFLYNALKDAGILPVMEWE